MIPRSSQSHHVKSETVSFRVDSRIRTILEEEARKAGVTLNTLVSQIFLRFVMWGRYAGRLKLIPVSKDLLRDLFGSMDKETIGDVAKRLAETSGREHILFLYQELNLGTFVQFVDMWSSHFDAYEHRYDGKMHFYTVHHDINLNFSLFAKEYLSAMIQSVAPRQARFESVAPNSLTFKFEGDTDSLGTASSAASKLELRKY